MATACQMNGALFFNGPVLAIVVYNLRPVDHEPAAVVGDQIKRVAPRRRYLQSAPERTRPNASVGAEIALKPTIGVVPERAGLSTEKSASFCQPPSK